MLFTFDAIIGMIFYSQYARKDEAYSDSIHKLHLEVSANSSFKTTYEVYLT